MKTGPSATAFALVLFAGLVLSACIVEAFGIYQVRVANDSGNERLLVLTTKVGGDSLFEPFFVPADGLARRSPGVPLDDSIADVLVYDASCHLLSTFRVSPGTYDVTIGMGGAVSVSTSDPSAVDADPTFLTTRGVPCPRSLSTKPD